MKVHATNPLSLETGCGIRFNERLSRGETREVLNQKGRIMMVSTLWRERGHSDVTCGNCLKRMS